MEKEHNRLSDSADEPLVEQEPPKVSAFTKAKTAIQDTWHRLFSEEIKTVIYSEKCAARPELYT